MLREQDQGLEELGTAVDRVGRMADAMNQELNAQNRMLGDLEVEVENTNEQMNFVMGKLSKLLKTKGKLASKGRGGEKEGKTGGDLYFVFLTSSPSLDFIFTQTLHSHTRTPTQTSTSCGSSSS